MGIWLFFSSRLKRKVYPKKYILLEYGELENYLSFVEEGMIRFYIPRLEQSLLRER